MKTGMINDDPVLIVSIEELGLITAGIARIRNDLEIELREGRCFSDSLARENIRRIDRMMEELI